MFSLLGYFTKETLQDLIFKSSQLNDSVLIVFHVHEDQNISDFNLNSEKIFFIKIPSFIFNGKFLNSGFLVYKADINLKFYCLNANSDLVMAKLNNTSFYVENAFMMTNIVKNDDGNNLVFFLYNFLGIDKKIIGIDFDKIDKNSIFYNGAFYDYFFLVFELKGKPEFAKYDDFWEDYLGPFIITEAIDGGFNNISWQNPIQFFIQKIHSLLYENIENNIKYFPLKVMSLKKDYLIVKLKVDFKRSIDMIFNDISIFSYQYASIQKCNIYLLFDRIKRSKKKFNFNILSGDLLDIIKEETRFNFNLKRFLALRKFTGIMANILILPTRSTPLLTSDCIFSI